MPELGAEMLRRMGATVVTTPGAEIGNALKSGEIDAAEWVGPWADLALGLDKAADYTITRASTSLERTSPSASTKNSGTAWRAG